MLSRLSITTGNIAASLILGHVALVYVFIVYPEFAESMIGVAEQVKAYLVKSGLPSRYNAWLRLLLEEKQLLLMFFTIMARIVLSLFTSAISFMWRRLRPVEASSEPYL